MGRFQRARKPEEKDVRRQSILRAARKIAHVIGPIELTLNEVGRRSGVSKPNIYRYFESREEILLLLCIAELEDLVASVEEGLGSGKREIKTVAQCLAREYLARPLLCQLLGMVASILEHNISVEGIAAAKKDFALLTQRCAALLARAMPWLSEDHAAWASHTIALYLAAMWPAAHPSHAAVEVLKRPEFAPLKIDAERDLKRFIELLLSGLKAESRSRA